LAPDIFVVFACGSSIGQHVRVLNGNQYTFLMRGLWIPKKEGKNDAPDIGD
jgi:hypothetical protein